MWYLTVWSRHMYATNARRESWNEVLAIGKLPVDVFYGFAKRRQFLELKKTMFTALETGLKLASCSRQKSDNSPFKTVWVMISLNRPVWVLLSVSTWYPDRNQPDSSVWSDFHRQTTHIWPNPHTLLNGLKKVVVRRSDPVINRFLT